MSINKIDEDLILDLLREKESYSDLNEYISQKKIKKSIDYIIKQLDKRLNKILHRFFVKN